MSSRRIERLTQKALELGEQSAGGWALAPPRRLDALAGERLGRRPGSSLEFEEYREYHPGDDLRHLDWGLYGRSDRLMVRLFREEIQPHLDLLIDGSLSMTADGIGIEETAASGSTPGGWLGHAKRSATLALAAFLTQTALAGGFTYRSWWGGERCRPVAASPVPPTAWSIPSFDHRGDLAGALGTARWHRRGLRVLLSDLLFASPAAEAVARLSEGAASTVVIRIASRRELRPRPRGFARLEDLESGERLDLLIDDEAVAAYRKNLERHQERWRQACHEAGVLWLLLEAEELLGLWESGGAGGAPAPLLELVRRGVLSHRATGGSAA